MSGWGARAVVLWAAALAAPRDATAVEATGSSAAPTAQLATSIEAPAPAHGGTAQRLFDEGRVLLERGDVAAACAKFEASQELEVALGTQMNLARCYALLGQAARAYSLFAEAAVLAERKGQVKRARAARDQLRELAPKVGLLTLLVPASLADRLRVERDGVVVPPREWGTPRAVEPGVHRIVLSGIGSGAAWQTDVRVAPGAVEHTFAIPREVLRVFSAPAAPVHTLEPGGSAAASIGLAPPPAPGSDDAGYFAPLHRKLGLGALGIGALALGAGGYFAARALHHDRASNASCEGEVCTSLEALAERETAREYGNAATVAVAAGGAALAVGVVLLVLPAAPEPASFSWLVVPRSVAGGAVLDLEGTF